MCGFVLWYLYVSVRPTVRLLVQNAFCKLLKILPLIGEITFIPPSVCAPDLAYDDFFSPSSSSDLSSMPRRKKKSSTISSFRSNRNLNYNYNHLNYNRNHQGLIPAINLGSNGGIYGLDNWLGLYVMGESTVDLVNKKVIFFLVGGGLIYWKDSILPRP